MQRSKLHFLLGLHSSSNGINGEGKVALTSTHDEHGKPQLR